MPAFMETEIARRPLRSRQTAWANAMARLLVRWRVSPNAISVASVFCALLSAIALLDSNNIVGVPRALLFLSAIAGIQGRIICNLLDGMVAVEGGQRTMTGELYNDLPDRIADPLLFVSAGYAVRPHPLAIEFGFMAAALAIFTAYIRMLGGASGLRQSFIGPMAKQHRMAVLTAACVLSIFETRLFPAGTALWIALIVINVGCLVTIWRRTARMARELESR